MPTSKDKANSDTDTVHAWKCKVKLLFGFFLQNPGCLPPAYLAHPTGWSRRKKSQRSCGRRRLKTAWPASASRASTWLGCTITEPPSLPQLPHPPWPPPRHRADTPPLNLILEAPHAIWSAWGWWHWYVRHRGFCCLSSHCSCWELGGCFSSRV